MNKQHDWIIPTIHPICELLKFKNGWDTYGGRHIEEDIIANALAWTFEVFPKCSLTPSVVPTSHGGLQYEWHRCGIDLEVEFVDSVRVHACYADHKDCTLWDLDVTTNTQPVRDALRKMIKRSRNLMVKLAERPKGVEDDPRNSDTTGA